MEKLTGDYIQAKRVWNEMKFAATRRECTDEELTQLRDAYEIVKKHDEKK
jgi:hypothetical protein